MASGRASRLPGLAEYRGSVATGTGQTVDWVAYLAEWLAWSQGNVLDALALVDEERARSRPAATAPSIAFHAWHLARWADRHAAALPRWLAGHDDQPPPGDEIWVREGLGAAWGFDLAGLGDYQIGAGLDDAASAALPLPALAELRPYVAAAFAALEATVPTIAPSQLALTVTDLYGDRTTVAEVVGGVISHTDRHLGMIEALRGVLGERGTATV